MRCPCPAPLLILALLIALLPGCREGDDSQPPTPYEGDEAGECTDRADNDQDGLFDCADEGCHGSPDCVGTGDDDDHSGDDDDSAGADDDSGDDDDQSLGYQLFEDTVLPELLENCAQCHLGDRFGFASLQHPDDPFPGAFPIEVVVQANYRIFRHLISIDSPTNSRLLAKVLPEESPQGVQHAGGPLLEAGDALHSILLDWILAEKAERCPTCGPETPRQYLAYVDAPNLYWALDRDPVRSDHGVRDGSARIMLQPIDPATFQPEGEPIDFLDGALCNEAGECDFGHLAINHAGDRMVFECRLPVQPGDDWVNDTSWNLCIAGIGEDGRAVDAGFLMPPERRHRGRTFARGSPFGLYTESGLPLKGVWDHHFRVRKSDDRTPIFSPDDQRVFLSSRGPDPRSGQRATRTYHGFEFVNNIISVASDGGDPRSIYTNEGGTADFPFFLNDGLLGIHAWNLERMDRHLYIRSSPDGMMEMPPLFGRQQGANMWGKAIQLANGSLLGMTGRRRGSVELWQPFLSDHTLGTGIEEGLTSYALLDPETDTLESHFAYCSEPPDGINCVVPRFYADPAWSPDGRAFIALNPEPTYVTQGDAMYGLYSSGTNLEERLASLQPYLPQRMGIWLLDHKGARQPFIEPPAGRMFRYPAWVGPRSSPPAYPEFTDESADRSELHIADVPIWFSFRHSDGVDKSAHFEKLSTITSLRVLTKVMGNNNCLLDGRPYRNAVHDSHDHPSHLGINNSSGYQRLVVPQAQGGDAFGDIALQEDGSILLLLPVGELLLFQGIDAEGHVVRQHSRVFALPPGHQIDSSVKREQYNAHCSACHGVIQDGDEYFGLQETDQVPPVPSHSGGATDASQAAAVDLTGPAVDRQTMTFLHQLRPLLDSHCVSCHSGATPAAELSLEAEYSTTANYPQGWLLDDLDPDFLDFVPEAERVPGYNFSVPYSWLLHNDNVQYSGHQEYATLVADHAPLGELAPWDPAYQNLMLNLSGARYYFLGGDGYASHYGRADSLGGNSQNAWLLEVLTGRDLEPDRDFTGPDHTGYLDETEVRLFAAIMDVGFPYMSRCDDKVIPSGPNAGEFWGDPEVIEY